MFDVFWAQPWALPALLLLGAFSGFLAGLLGIGGGMVLVPALSWWLSRQGVAHELVLKMALATSLASICFTSLSSVRAHHRLGNVQWSVVVRTAPGVLLGAWLGAQAAKALPSHLLSAIFAVIVALAASQMAFGLRPRAQQPLPGAAGQSLAGLGIGSLASLAGLGGGFVSVPWLSWCSVPIHQAVATSAALGFPVAMGSTLGYVSAGWGLAGLPEGALGFVHGPLLMVVVLASISTAPWGARTAQRMNTLQLKRAFAGLLYLLSAHMAWQAWIGR